MKKLYCVRHGRTAWNALGRFQGQTDVPLDDTGRDQVRATALRLQSVDFDYAVGSNLERARETMQILTEGRELTPELDQDWRERNFGAWEGLTWAQITERNPNLSNSLALGVREFQPENGEHFDHVKARVLSAYHRAIARIRDEQTALVVAHAGVLHALLDALFGGDRIATMILPAGVLEIEIHADRVVFVEPPAS